MKKNSMVLRLLAFVLALALLVPAAVGAEDDLKLAQDADIRIMSYNVMNPDWSKAPVGDRVQNVVNILLDYTPDVVGMQETNAKWHKALKPLLVETGLYTPACRQSNAEGFKYNMTSFLYNPQTVNLVEEYVFDLDTNSDIRVLAIAVFEKIADGTRFVVTNTHPASSTDTADYERNFADLMGKGAVELEKYADLPLIMTGDFNTGEEDEMYGRFMEALGVKDAKYEAEVLVRNHCTYAGWPMDLQQYEQYYIDHIFVDDQSSVKLFNVIVDHDTQTTSDHFPIYADIDLQ